MAKVTLKINGQEVEVEKGSTILEAAKQAGVYIPTLCYHPYLPLEEACRICVVEEQRGGWSTQVAACVYPVRQGMIIETDSEKVLDSRKTIMDLLLSNHPNDCMTCQATGECELQDMAYRYGSKGKAYEGARASHPIDSDPNPNLHIDMNKCILCRRCIRACHDIEGADIWTKVGRGFYQRISTAFDQTLIDAGCEMCGHCADFCPVDAIGYRAGRGTVRSWQLRKSSTVCLQCPSGCRAEYDSYQNKVVRVLGDFTSPASSGALCKMGRFSFDFINTPDRLASASMKNEKGELADCTVDEALKTAASALEKVRDTAGGGAIGVICGGMLTNEEYYMAQKLARGALATNNIDNVAGPWQQAAYEGLSNSIGFGAMTNTLDDIAKAGTVLVLGSNTLEKQAIAALRARKAQREGGELIVAYPDKIALTKTASIHLPIKSGSEDALVLGLMKVIVAEELFDKEFIEKFAQDLPKLSKSLEKINMADLAEKTGVAEDQIAEAARLYASKKPACLIYGIDTKTSPTNESFYRLCGALQVLMGSIGVVGGGANVLGASGNAQGAADFGALAKYLPGYRPATAAASRKVVKNLWGVDSAEKAGLSWPDMIAAVEKGDIKALYLVGVNPFDLGLDKAKVEAALAKLELLILEDTGKSDAVNFAHVVLPSTTFVEKAGTATNCERRVQKLEAVLASPGDARSDFDLINGILGYLNPQLKKDDLDSAFGEAVQLISDMNGVSSAQIPIEGIQWPVDASGAGTARLIFQEDAKSKLRLFAVRL